MFALIRFCLLLYVAVMVVVFLGQRQLQYHPAKGMDGGPGHYGVPDMHVVTVRTDDGLSLSGWYVPPAPGRPVVVLFHGNAGHIGDRAFKARLLIDAGFGVLLAEYRGYGVNPGAPDEVGFYKDARAFLDFLKREKISDGDIVLYGESIGTGVAVQMAAEREGFRALILEAPFSSAVDVGRGVYWWLPVGLLMQDKFMSIDKIGAVHTPLLVVHGDADRVVPFHLGRRLFDAALNPKTFVAVKGGGHSDLYDFGAGRVITDFLAQVSMRPAEAKPASP